MEEAWVKKRVCSIIHYVFVILLQDISTKIMHLKVLSQYKLLFYFSDLTDLQRSVSQIPVCSFKCKSSSWFLTNSHCFYSSVVQTQSSKLLSKLLTVTNKCTNAPPFVTPTCVTIFWVMDFTEQPQRETFGFKLCLLPVQTCCSGLTLLIHGGSRSQLLSHPVCGKT